MDCRINVIGKAIRPLFASGHNLCFTSYCHLQNSPNFCSVKFLHADHHLRWNWLTIQYVIPFYFSTMNTKWMLPFLSLVGGWAHQVNWFSKASSVMNSRKLVQWSSLLFHNYFFMSLSQFAAIKRCCSLEYNASTVCVPFSQTCLVISSPLISNYH